MLYAIACMKIAVKTSCMAVAHRAQTFQKPYTCMNKKPFSDQNFTAENFYFILSVLEVDVF
jgi:hypothetical protein